MLTLYFVSILIFYLKIKDYNRIGIITKNIFYHSLKLLRELFILPTRQ